MYDEFMVADEGDNYRMTLGTPQDVLGTKLTENSFEFQNNMQFSTFERDNDVSTRKCAKLYPSGWWFSDCYSVSLNGIYKGKTFVAIGWDEITWYKVNGEDFQKNIIKVRMLVRKSSALVG